MDRDLRISEFREGDAAFYALVLEARSRLMVLVEVPKTPELVALLENDAESQYPMAHLVDYLQRTITNIKHQILVMLGDRKLLAP